MVSRFILFLILFISINKTIAKDTPELFKVHSFLSSTHIPLVMNHLKTYESDYSTYLKNLAEVSNNLYGHDLKTIRVFLFSEYYKVFFNLTSIQSLDLKNSYISNSVIMAVKEKRKQYSSLYSPFARFLIDDSIKNYDNFIKNGKLNLFEDKKLNSKKESSRIKLLNKHIGPWIILFFKYDSAKFHQIIADVTKQYINNLKRVSYYFKYNNLKTHKEKIFIINPKKLENVPVAEDKNKQQSPQKLMDKIKVDKSEVMEDKIDQIIEKIN